MAVSGITLWMGVSCPFYTDETRSHGEEGKWAFCQPTISRVNCSRVCFTLSLLGSASAWGGRCSQWVEAYAIIFGFGFLLINQLRIILSTTEMIGENLFVFFFKSLGIIISMALLLCQELVPRILQKLFTSLSLKLTLCKTITPILQKRFSSYSS